MLMHLFRSKAGSLVAFNHLLRTGACGFLALTLWSYTAAGAMAGVTEATQAPAHQTAENPADFAGSESCATCHADIAKGLVSNPHNKNASMHADKGITCEGCHGPAKAHVQSGGDVSKIFRFAKAAPKQIDEKCVQCHQGDHSSFERSAHGEANVSCLNCHGIHKPEEKAHLLKASQPNLCYGCHSDVKPDFIKPFHHKVDGGSMSCSDCHNPHETFKQKGLASAVHQDPACVKCHTETAGPFAFEHPPVKTEGCTSCHSPHGSANPRLLTRSNVNALCSQCHGFFNNSTAPIPEFHDQAAQHQACTVCHTQVHGSNASPFFFK